jgi:hypothetical protein
MKSQHKPWLGIFLMLGLGAGWKYLDYLEDYLGKNSTPSHNFRFGANGTIVIPSSPELSQKATRSQ